jgi:ABC-type branched-subunit amino acid transport system substrate-binding protein
VAAVVLGAALVLAACDDDGDDGEEPDGTAGRTPSASGTLKIGGLFSFTGGLAEFGPPIRNGAALGVRDCNEAGGNVELAEADDGTEATVGVDAANQLLDVEGAHVLLGPMGSGVSAAVVEAVSAPDGILTVSASATGPDLTDLDDDDFFFRTTVSDVGQGGVLARVADDAGYTTVGVMHENSVYGQGLAEVFKEQFEALGGGRTANLVPYEAGQASYVSELQQATAGADALAAIGYPVEAQVYVREALSQGLVQPGAFLFVDGTRSQDILDTVGAEQLNGSVGTFPGQAPTTEQRATFISLYEEEYGDFPPTPFIAEAYDAAALFCLAFAQAGSTDSAELRDALREVSSPGGTEVSPGVEGLTEALQLIADGEDVDYEGWASSTNFDDNGDVLQGSIQRWEITNGAITDVGEPEFVDLSDGGEDGGTPDEGGETPEGTP